MNVGDRVTLRSDRTWFGHVSGLPGGGEVLVTGDDDREARVPESEVVLLWQDKSWPPAGMETK